MSKLTTRLTALLLSGMLVIGSVPGSVLAASTDVDPGQTSEIAQEVYEEESSEAPADVEETGEIEETSEAPVTAGEMAETAETSETPADVEESLSEEASAEEAQYYNVTLDANRGYFENEWDDSIGDYAQQAEVVEKHIPVDGTVASFPVYINPDGQTMLFAGWSLERDGELVAQAGEEYIPLDNCVLYAVWQAEDAALGESGEQEVADECTELDDTAQETDTAEEPEDSDAIEETEVVLGQEDDEDIAETGTGFEETKEAEEDEHFPENTSDADENASSDEDTEEQIADNKKKEPEEELEPEEYSSEDFEKGNASSIGKYSAGDTGTWGNNLEWSLAGQEGNLTLTVTCDGEMKECIIDYTDYPWYWNADEITELVINPGITIIPKDAFMSLKIIELNIPEGVQSIGKGSFGWCYDLQQVTLPQSLTSIGEKAFMASDLTDVDIPENVTSIGQSAFYGCDQLEFVRFRKKISTIEMQAFDKCTGLTDVYYEGSESEWAAVTIKTYNDALLNARMHYNWVENNLSDASVTLKDVFKDEEGNDCCAYTGAQITPGVLEVRLGDNLLVEGTDYTVEYGTNLSYGEGTVTIKGAGGYEGEQTVKFLVVPAKVEGLKGNNDLSTDSVAYTNYRRGLDLTWNKQNGEGILYEIQYSKTADFREKETIAVSENVYSELETPLKRKTTYYVRVRAYLEINGQYVNGQWSDTLTVKSGAQILASEMWAVRNDSDTYTDFRTDKKMFNDVFGSGTGELVFDFYCSFLPEEKYGDDWVKAGLCNGLLNTGIAYYEYDTPVYGSYPQKITHGNYNTAKSSELNFSWLDSVKYAQIAQNAVNPQEEIRTIRYDLNSFYDAVQKCEKGEGHPVSIGFGRMMQGGHELMAIGISNETDSEVDIEIYDVNSIIGDEVVPRYLKLYKVGDLKYEWKYDNAIHFDPETGEINETETFSGTIYENPGIEGAPYFYYSTTQAAFDSQILSDINRNGYVKDTAVEADTTDKKKQALEVENWFEDENIALQNTLKTKDAIEWCISQKDVTGNGDTESHAYWIDGNDIDLSDVPQGVALALASKNHYAKVQVQGVSDVYLQVPDDKASIVRVLPEESDTYEITLIDGEGRPSTYTEKTELRADAVAHEELAIIQNGDAIEFQGVNSINISRFSGNENENGSIHAESEIEISSETDPAINYRFTKDDDTARIVGDLDGDGEYETTITEKDITYNGPKIVASGTCGEKVTWKLDEDGLLTVSGEGEMANYSSSDKIPWSSYEIKKVIIEEGITSIGVNAFAYCTGLASVTIPDSVTSIGKYAFEGCSSLTGVTIPDSVTSIEYFAFSECSSLTSVMIPNSVTSIENSVFYDCGSLASVTIPDSVTSIRPCAFAYCTSLKSVTIPDSVTSIEYYAFSECSSLTRVTIPDSVTSIGHCAFAKCTNLKSVTIPDSVKDVDNSAFIHCRSLTNVTIPNSVKRIADSEFSDCRSLTSVTIPDSVTKIENYAFEGCSSLMSVTIPNSVTSIGRSAFDRCTYLNDVYYDGSKKEWSAISIGDENSELTNATIHFSLVSLAGASVSGLSAKTYTGKALTQTPVVTLDGNTLTKDTDYTVSYANNTNVGTATVTITGKGNYTGTVSKTFKINGIPVSNATVSGISNKTYTGSALTQNPTVKVGDQTLTKDTDYTVSYANNTKVGTATVKITGKGNYTGTVSKTFKINGIPVSNATVSGISNKTYTGSALTQNPTVKVGDKTLTKNTDYTVSYQNNTNVGTATVTITGKGNYASKKNVTFKINKAAQSITAKAGASRVAVGKTTTVSITGNKGKKSYKSSNTAIATVDSSTGKVTAKKVGTVKITATSAATANYKAASKTVTIKVVPAATTSLTAANQPTGIKLTWKKVIGANGYKVYRGSTLIKTITSGSTVSFVDKKANTNGTKYTYKVVAKATTGDSTLSRSRVIYRVSRPAVSSVRNSASKKMTVKWGKNAKANGYQIQYSMDKNFKSGNKAVSITSASTVSKVIGSLTKGKTYYVRIRTYKTVGSTKYWSIWSAARSVKISK